jgi:hypothetical protein
VTSPARPAVAAHSPKVSPPAAAAPETASAAAATAATSANPKPRPAARRGPAPEGQPAPAAAEARPTPAPTRIPWFAASPLPAGSPAAGTAARPGSILQQIETRPVSSWLSGQAEQNDGPEPDHAPPAIPGAYLAPSAAFSAPLANALAGRTFDPPSSSRSAAPAYATSATGAASPVAFAPAFSAPAAPGQGAGLPARAARVSIQAPTELPGWLAIAGSAIAAVSFLMPWSRDGVIGAVGSGYFDRWGLANPGYLPLVIVVLALLAINGAPTRIPSWIRAGLAPLAIGGVLFGLDWAYQTRPYSDGLGVTLLLVSALVLMIGGLIGVRSGRHSAPPPLV